MTPRRRAHKSAPVPAVQVPDTAARHVDRLEVILVVALVMIGVAARVARFELTAIEHFDEGVYASNLLFDESTNFQYPMRHLYAPPLLPAFIEASIIAYGELSSRIAIVPSLILGCGTLVALWWLARSCLNSASAIAALCLIAASDVHIMFSRAALTDAPLLLFFVLAMYLLQRASVSRRIGDFILAGGVVGVAWWTKYNGWLPLLIAAPAFVMQFYRTRSKALPRVDNGARNILLGWAIAAVTAAVVWSPYLISLRDVGGYQAVARNHQQYLVGLTGWPASLEHQLANLRFVDSVPANISLGIALFVAWLVRRTSSSTTTEASTIDRDELLRMGLAASTLVVAGNILGTGLVCLILAATGVCVAIAQLTFGRESDAAANSESAQLLISWFAVLAVMTPLYTPFLRLVLPLMASAWMLGGWSMDRLSRWLIVSGRRESRVLRAMPTFSWAIALAGMVSALVLLNTKRDLRPFAWRDDRRGLERIAQKIHQQRATDTTGSDSRLSESLYYVYGEPALLYQLRASGEPLVTPVNSIPRQAVRVHDRILPTYLLSGLHADKDPSFRQALADASGQIRLVETFEYRPSWLVLLDQYHPDQLGRNHSASVRLFAVSDDSPPANPLPQ